jgi:uncharacterized membrane protein YadS
MRWLNRTLRLMCAIALAVTATFHVCDVTAANAVGLVFAADASDKGKASDVAAVEKCHTCAVVSLPVLAASAASDSPVRGIPSGAILHLAPFREAVIGPPPRA